MSKIERYRQVLYDFMSVCAAGAQNCSLSAFFRKNGLDVDHIGRILKDDYPGVKAIPGYRHMISRVDKGITAACAKVYEDFKALCAEGRQPGPFSRYCVSHGITRRQMHNYLKHRRLRVMGLPGYTHPTMGVPEKIKNVPFENIIFEEAGFLPAASSVITIKVDDRVAVCFPADTDVAIIAKFVRKLGKGGGHVGA